MLATQIITAFSKSLVTWKHFHQYDILQVSCTKVWSAGCFQKWNSKPFVGLEVTSFCNVSLEIYSCVMRPLMKRCWVVNAACFTYKRMLKSCTVTLISSVPFAHRANFLVFHIFCIHVLLHHLTANWNLRTCSTPSDEQWLRYIVCLWPSVNMVFDVFQSFA